MSTRVGPSTHCMIFDCAPMLLRPFAAIVVTLLTLGAAAARADALDDAGAQHFADQVVRAHDAGGRAFAVVDKPSATLWVFDRQGRALGRSPVLVGQAPGDVAPPDIGTRPLARVKPSEKITAAGRYITEAGRNAQGEDIVWLDYHQALSMHRVRNVKGENRPQRLITPGVADNRISFGCVNMQPSFYERYIDPMFGKQKGVVYVLPETQPVASLFPFAQDHGTALAGAAAAPR